MKATKKNLEKDLTRGFEFGIIKVFQADGTPSPLRHGEKTLKTDRLSRSARLEMSVTFQRKPTKSARIKTHNTRHCVVVP